MMRVMVSEGLDLSLMTVHLGLEQMREDWAYLDRLGISAL
jgi:hypothetical protein